MATFETTLVLLLVVALVGVLARFVTVPVTLPFVRARALMQVINGLTLPLFIRWLGVHGDGIAQREDRAARIALAQAGNIALRSALSRLSRPEEIALASRLAGDYERLLLRLSANAARRAGLDALAGIERGLVIVALEAQRAELLEMRNSGTINDETMRAIEAEIDDAEASLGPAPTKARA